jgi:hypothetical protein
MAKWWNRIVNVMLMKRVLFFCLFFTMVLAGCQHPRGDRASVSINLSNGAGLKLILQEMGTSAIHALDSVVLDQGGCFTFNVVVKETGFWLIKAPTGKILVLLLNSGDKVELSGSAREFPDHVTLKGPDEAIMLNDFYSRTRQKEILVDSLEMLLVERQDSSDYYQLTQKLDTSFRRIWESQRSEEMDFINTHPGSLASLLVLNYAFGMSPVLSPEEDFNYYLKLDSALMIRYPENKHVRFHHQRVEEIRKSKTHR